MSIDFRTHFSTLLLVFATVMLVMTCFSTPFINNFALGVVKTNGGSDVIRYGVFGYCQTAGIDQCTSRSLGYRITESIHLTAVDESLFPNTLNTLTYGLVMHPVAAGFSGLGLIIAMFSNRVGFFFVSLLTAVAFICSIAAMAIDLALFGQLKSKMEDVGNATGEVQYGPATWVTVAAAGLLFIATFASFFQCVCGGGNRRKAQQMNMQRPQY